MMWSESIRGLIKNQLTLRVEKYLNLSQSNSNCDTQDANLGKRVVLPSSYVGSRRYMDRLYFKEMVICSYVGFSDLLITFTCNPNWPEIQHFLGPFHLKLHECLEIISRVFKIKFDELLSDLAKKWVMGKFLACKSIF